jgi:hypothetical protein
MSEEFIQSFGDAWANNTVWAEVIMRAVPFAVILSVILLMMVECGHLVYHLSMLVW